MKNPAEIKNIVEDLALPLVEGQGLKIWGLEVVPGPTLKVCLFIDGGHGAEGQTGATIDQCEKISRQLGLALDVEDIIEQSWELEVSSPGLNRKFFTLEQLGGYLGDILDVKLADPLAGSNRKVWRGRLCGIEGNILELAPCSVTPEGEIALEPGDVVKIPWEAVARAQRAHVFAMPRKPGKKAAGKIKGA